MVSDLIRDAPVGQIVRFITRNKVFQYPEERDDWSCPVADYEIDEKHSKALSQSSTTVTSPAPETEKKELDFAPANHLSAEITRPDVDDSDSSSSHSNVDLESAKVLSRSVTRSTLTQVKTQASLNEAFHDAIRQETIKTQPSRALVPERTADNRVLITWYTTDDEANPQNWSQKKKVTVILQIYLFSLAIYMAGAIVTPAIPTLIQKFNLSPSVASMSLSIYVLGYGLGPLILSPLSEIPSIGRNPPYVIPFFLFLIVTIPLALIENYPGFVVLRFFQGVFGSPALATGSASITDMYSLLEMPYYLTAWAGFVTAGPALGPLISGFSVPVMGWHWSMWEVLWLAGPIFVAFMVLLPETNSSTILLHRAQRLRLRLEKEGKTTEAARLVAQSEMDQANMTVGQIARENLLRPFQINLLDPSVAFTSIYIGLLYGIFYSFFEAFPIVYGQGLPGKATHGYGMNLGEQGLIFLSVSVGVAVAIAIYVAYLYFKANPALRAALAKGEFPAPEGRLVPGLYASILAALALFWFAWTADSAPKIHWIVPTLAIVVIVASMFLVFQVIFIYVALTYPQYAASLFAMNDAVRSSMAVGSIHFSLPLFHNLGVGRAASLLGGLLFIGVIGVFTLYMKGSWLRNKSRFAAK